MWIKPDTLANSPLLFYQAGSASLQFDEAGTRLRMYVVTGGAAYAEAVTDPAALCDGNWHYLAGVYDGGAIRLYVDGVATGTTPGISGNIAPGSAANCFIGVYAPGWTGPSRFFDGWLDEIRISTTPATAGEIAATWATRDTHEAVTSRCTAPAPWRRVMLSSVEVLNGGSASYAVSADDGATWTPATPWTWTTVETPGTQWRIRATVAGLANIKRLGLVGMP
jgi:hypothetical protein